jgi:hypothetical protein
MDTRVNVPILVTTHPSGVAQPLKRNSKFKIQSYTFDGYKGWGFHFGTNIPRRGSPTIEKTLKIQNPTQHFSMS